MRDLFALAWFRSALTIIAVVATAAAFIGANLAHQTHLKIATAEALTGGDAGRAPTIFRRYGCSGCHTIPSIPGADGQVGAPLTDYSKRTYIAGVLENRSDNLVAWLVSPRRFSPKTAMPETGISDQEAKDLAAYLYAQ